LTGSGIFVLYLVEIEWRITPLQLVRIVVGVFSLVTNVVTFVVRFFTGQVVNECLGSVPLLVQPFAACTLAQLLFADLFFLALCKVSSGQTF